MARQTLEQWIFEAINDTDKGRPCTGLALIHKVGTRDQDIHATKLGNRQWDTKDLAALFRGKAENYAAELVGVQTFNLLAFYGGSSEPEAIKPFTINGKEDFDGLATEGPTRDGMLQQMMRHVEAERQIGARQVQALTSTMADLTNSVARENIALRSENREMFDLIKQLLMRETENRDSARMRELEYQRASEERQRLLTFAPALINRIFNREVLPESMEDTALIETMAHKITDSDIAKLANAGLSPDIWGPLAARMSGILERKRLAHDQARKAMNGVDPETDATGLEPEERKLQ